MANTEVEVFGVNYERYSLGKELQRFVAQMGIQTVCELPAHGAKAAPSLYSLDFARAGCRVTLINGERKSLRFYKMLGIENAITFADQTDLERTTFANDTFDFVWNFAFIPMHPNPAHLLTEMTRISKKYVALFSVNKRNIGFCLHKFAHWRTQIPWSHGDTRFNSPTYLKNFMHSLGLQNIRVGVVDCPVWPDSIGFRDIRLHRNPVDFAVMDWEVPYVDYLVNKKFPGWFPWVYGIERLPLPLLLKFLYAHIFYIVGEKQGKQ